MIKKTGKATPNDLGCMTQDFYHVALDQVPCIIQVMTDIIRKHTSQALI